MESDFFDTLPTGRRVVLRYRLPACEVPAGAPRYSDALGSFLGFQGASVRILTRSGEVLVPLASVTLAKEVPEAPARRRPREPYSGA
ncbi:acetyltransferase [Paeniglutamicibacter cryotolerans]|uniref:Histone acetyltransferase Rv0428c-like SH3 domain-containing protein n=1 Tax=Paeniglutamicibacter cryotolerans TaxID=670079 RepID=A0A839QL09_9MICC|nr:hypothetical protein [Paeniglutamicibacter cryotolerans]MBB2996500.1 hypothetical protein [Paeniglutamicibacter cryotolerans]